MVTKATKSAAGKNFEAEASTSKPKSQTMLFIIGIILVLVITGGAVLMIMGSKPKKGEEQHVQETSSIAPIFVAIEPFVVNLQHDNGDQFLQLSLTLQVPNKETAETIKLFMPQVRSRLLMVLSNKKASELSSREGKNDLADEIIDLLGEPFNREKGPIITDVFYTSFVIQQQ